jgi:branched-chain amino acid transport system ATP-binding protein
MITSVIGLEVRMDDRLAEIFGIFPELEERRRQIVGTMSGGQQQMLAIGHALMPRLATC